MGEKLDCVSREEYISPLAIDVSETLRELNKVVRRARHFLSASWLVPLLFSVVLLSTDPVKHALSSWVVSVVSCGAAGSACGQISNSGAHSVTSINFTLPKPVNPLAWLGTHLWFWTSALAVTFVIVGVIWILRTRSSEKTRILEQAAIAAGSGIGVAVLIDLVFALPSAGYLMGLAFSICVWAAIQGSVEMMVVGGTFLALAGPSTKLPLAWRSVGSFQISPQAELHAFWGIFLLVASVVIFLRTHSRTFMRLKRLAHDLLGKIRKSMPR